METDVQRAPEGSPDEQALQRYRYLVRTAPPEAIEQAHREAFERLTPAQRQQLLQELNAAAPANERMADATRADPQSLARMATRAEIRQPGSLERTLSGPGLGGMFASSLLGSVVGSVIGSAIAHQLFGGFGHSPMGGDQSDSDAVADSGTDDSDSDAVADNSDTDVDGGDFGDPGGGFGDDL